MSPNGTPELSGVGSGEKGAESTAGEGRGEVLPVHSDPKVHEILQDSACHTETYLLHKRRGKKLEMQNKRKSFSCHLSHLILSSVMHKNDSGHGTQFSYLLAFATYGHCAQSVV